MTIFLRANILFIFTLGIIPQFCYVTIYLYILKLAIYHIPL